jgi:hypothetical protein
MKTQISLVLAATATMFFSSCQKEAANSKAGGANSTTNALAKNQTHRVQSGVPFKGEYDVTITILNPPPNVLQKVEGTGVASLIGNSTFEATTNVTITPPPPFAVSGTRTITAANGDKIFTSFSGTSTPVVDGKNGADLIETVTGGTGRFKNATGSFTVKAQNDVTNNVYKAYFDGYIRF